MFLFNLYFNNIPLEFFSLLQNASNAIGRKKQRVDHGDFNASNLNLNETLEDTNRDAMKMSHYKESRGS